MSFDQSSKRKSGLNKDCNRKRLHVSESIQDSPIDKTSLPPRPTTPPLGMTLSHYNSNTGAYVSSQLNSDQEMKSIICSGMTPIYCSPVERWGSSYL